MQGPTCCQVPCLAWASCEPGAGLCLCLIELMGKYLPAVRSPVCMSQLPEGKHPLDRLQQVTWAKVRRTLWSLHLPEMKDR